MQGRPWDRQPQDVVLGVYRMRQVLSAAAVVHGARRCWMGVVAIVNALATPA